MLFRSAIRKWAGLHVCARHDHSEDDLAGPVWANTTPVYGDNIILPYCWLIVNDGTETRLWANTGSAYVSVLLS